MTPKKPDWFEMTEGDTPATGLRKVNKTLPVGALLIAGAVFFGGSIFAQDQNVNSNIASSPVAEPAPINSNIDSSSSVQNAFVVQAKAAPVSTAQVSSLEVPTIAPVVGISNSDDDDDDDDDRGRRGHDDDDDEDDEDEEDDD